MGYKSVRAAKESGRPGILTYVFERRADLQSALDAWDKAGEALRAGSLMLSTVDVAEAMPIIRATMFFDEKFDELWKTVPANLFQKNEGEVTESLGPEAKVMERDGGTRTYPGFKVISDNVKPEDVKKILK